MPKPSDEVQKQQQEHESDTEPENGCTTMKETEIFALMEKARWKGKDLDKARFALAKSAGKPFCQNPKLIVPKDVALMLNKWFTQHPTAEVPVNASAVAAQSSSASSSMSKADQPASVPKEKQRSVKEFKALAIELKELAALHKEGVLTDEEFAAAKKKLLNL